MGSNYRPRDQKPSTLPLDYGARRQCHLKTAPLSGSLEDRCPLMIAPKVPLRYIHVCFLMKVTPHNIVPSSQWTSSQYPLISVPLSHCPLITVSPEHRFPLIIIHSIHISLFLETGYWHMDHTLIAFIRLHKEETAFPGFIQSPNLTIMRCHSNVEVHSVTWWAAKANEQSLSRP